MIKDRQTDNEITDKNKTIHLAHLLLAGEQADHLQNQKKLNFTAAPMSIWTLISILTNINK